MTAANDSSELEALFDSIAANAPAVPQAAAAPAPEPAAAESDSDELQALFDNVASKVGASADAAKSEAKSSSAESEASGMWPAQESVFNSIGQMARMLHDTIRQLGYDKLLEKTVSALPDAKDRLAYVANLTEQAACRVLNATDVANPLVEEIESGAKILSNRWEMLYANQLSVDEFKQLAAETRIYLKQQVPQRTKATKAQLTEIMMAQDFQDLTGQVIKKIVNLAQELESGLMGVLIEVLPEDRRTQEVNALMNGPVINAEGRSDVVANQSQVDDLLDSLGF
ncbi:MAG: chemotaxis regulator CheZ [Betaproteobacteria bacterium ADurb.Bin341]|nr:MAG: chemotaxis regulator CheZ [Betaproteobacteria bacterium ADurb.Bin341]